MKRCVNHTRRCAEERRDPVRPRPALRAAQLEAVGLLNDDEMNRAGATPIRQARTLIPSQAIHDQACGYARQVFVPVLAISVSIPVAHALANE